VLTRGRWWFGALRGQACRGSTRRNAALWGAARTRVGGVAGDPSRWVGGIDGDRGHRPHGGLRSCGGGGNSPMFGKTASFMELSDWLRVGLLPPREHSGHRIQDRRAAGAFLL
jgi:hypothetical protein